MAPADLLLRSDAPQSEMARTECLNGSLCHVELIGSLDQSAVLVNGDEFPGMLLLQALAEALVEPVVFGRSAGYPFLEAFSIHASHPLERIISRASKRSDD
jgi:hypothetical protein